MNGTTYQGRLGWGARLVIGLALVLAGAGAATWGLARYHSAARVLGVVQQPTQPVAARPLVAAQPTPALPPAGTTAADQDRIARLENRLAEVENATQRAEGSAGRADALVVAFAARRAIDRGIALGYLENLLVERFGEHHQQAVASIITASHQPVRLDELAADYDLLGPELRSGGPQDGWWNSFRREMGSLVQVHRADRPSPTAEARYNRATQRLAAGQVDQALAETMRLPGAPQASSWVAKARRYIAVHRALDEIESAALLAGPSPA
ncbi:MAG: hypothetical protein ABIO80_06875 [Sphingomicrobium sp.]